MTDVLEQLIRSPRLPEYLSELQKLVSAEGERRQRFYAEMTESQKTEFINGEVIVHSPAKLRHNAVVKNILTVLDAYVRRSNLGYVGFEKLLVTLPRNDYEPDVCFFRREVADGFTPDQVHFPAPDLVVEVLSPGTEPKDRGVKFEDYAANGVQEYWLADPEREVIEQYLPRDGRYELRLKSDTGEVKCEAIAGLVVPVRALFDSAANQVFVRQVLR